MIYSFEKLAAYKEAKELVKTIYKLSKMFPSEEKYILCNQIQRASLSVVSNIAEGSGRVSNKERARFYEIAYGSLLEVLAQISIAYELKYINDECHTTTRKQIELLSWKLYKLHKSKKNS